MEDQKKKRGEEVKLKVELGVGAGVWGSRSGMIRWKARPAAVKVLKYSTQSRSWPINGKSFFDNSRNSITLDTVHV